MAGAQRRSGARLRARARAADRAADAREIGARQYLGLPRHPLFPPRALGSGGRGTLACRRDLAQPSHPARVGAHRDHARAADRRDGAVSPHAGEEPRESARLAGARHGGVPCRRHARGRARGARARAHPARQLRRAARARCDRAARARARFQPLGGARRRTAVKRTASRAAAPASMTPPRARHLEWLSLAVILLAAAWLHRGALRAPFFADDYLFLDRTLGRSLWQAWLA